MITPKGFVLLGSKSGGMRAGAHTKHTEANQPAGPLARASGAWYLLHRAVVLTCVFRGVVFCGVASLSSVDLSLLLWTAAGSCTGCYTQAWCTHTHKLGTHTHKLGTHTQAWHTHTQACEEKTSDHRDHTGITRAREKSAHGSIMLSPLSMSGRRLLTSCAVRASY